LAVFVAAIAGIVFGTSVPSSAQTNYDHLRCAKIKDPNRVEARISLEPRDATSTNTEKRDCRTTRASWLCEPAAATIPSYNPTPPGPIALGGRQSLTDLHICYKTRCRTEASDMIELTDPMGFRTVERRAMTSLVCTPAVEGPPPGASCLTYAAVLGGPDAGGGNGKFVLPAGVDVDADGNLYVADTGNNRIQVFDSNRLFVRKWGQLGTDDGQFVAPHDLAVGVDAQGFVNVYVADTDADRIQQFAIPDSEGVCPDTAQFVVDGACFIRTWGNFGTGNGDLISPIGIAVGNGGQVYVAETTNNRVQVFDADGNYVSQFGTQGNGDGQFLGPHGVAIGPNGDVYVADAGNNRVQVFTSEGVYDRQWGGLGDGDTQFRTPEDVAVSDAGVVFVSELAGNRVKAYDENGLMLARSDDRQGVEFSNPHGLAVYGMRLYVADEGNHRIQELLCQE
jgi:DNA-binding beta-propeller fold protein YncE